MNITIIDSQEFLSILENGSPYGLYILPQDGRYVAVDNAKGYAWTQEFDELEAACFWLLSDAAAEEVKYIWSKVSEASRWSRELKKELTTK